MPCPYLNTLWYFGLIFNLYWYFKSTETAGERISKTKLAWLLSGRQWPIFGETDINQLWVWHRRAQSNSFSSHQLFFNFWHHFIADLRNSYPRKTVKWIVGSRHPMASLQLAGLKIQPADVLAEIWKKVLLWMQRRKKTMWEASCIESYGVEEV